MQTQVVHRRKQTLPWIPMLVAAVLVAATTLGIQAALRDRGTVTAPTITSVEGPGVRGIGAHGAARIPFDESKDIALQKAAMVEAGITSVAGVRGDPVSVPDAQTAAREGGGYGVTRTATGEPHPRTKFGGSTEDRDLALRATIHRIALERRG
jgi:hypothetical protein